MIDAFSVSPVSLQLHPATRLLLNHQRAAQTRKLLRGFQTPRRLVLACLALVLSAVWVGQAILSIMLRQPASPESLRVWIPLGLLTYALWHVLKTACRLPVEPFEWTPAEQELLGAAPLRRRELVVYRLAGIAGSVTLKALCFSLLMIPDLPFWLAGFVGMFLALFFLDLLRMVVEIMAYGVTRQALIRFRMSALVIAAACVLSALISACCAPQAAEPNGSVALIMRFLGCLADMRLTWIGWLVQQPFQLFAHIILAPVMSGTVLANLVMAILMVWSMIYAVVVFDKHFRHLRVARERRRVERHAISCAAQVAGLEDLAIAPYSSTRSNRRTHSLDGRVPVRARGAGTLAWRQTLGAHHYLSSLLIAMVVPAVFSLVPLLTAVDGSTTLVHVAGGLVFYSFVLLPSALKFDFRRDVERIGVLKSLPISATATVVGQLAVPFCLTLLLELVVLLIVLVVRPYPPLLLFAALGLLVPVTWLIFAMENLIFLLYPYRLNQEGIHIFLRSILAFTAKGILFAAAVGMMMTWLFGAHMLANAIQAAGVAVPRQLVFTGGMWTFTCASALLATWALVRVYDRFDPSQDTPGIS